MNIRRGFFRLWIFVALLWALLVAVLSFGTVRQEFVKAADERAMAEMSIVLIPALCGDARGDIGKDYSTDKMKGPGPWDKDAYPEPNPFDTCWYELPSFRRLYKEYSDLNDDDLVAKTYAKFDMKVSPSAHPWRRLSRVLMLVFLPPAMLFVVGCLLAWVGSGFLSATKGKKSP
jgi:hypothetical protein